MSGLVLLHCQRSPEDLQQLLAWYKIRDMLLGQNCVKQDIKNSLELASVCKHTNAVWLAKLFAGRDVASREEARQVFLGCENDARALCFAGLLGGSSVEIRRAADLGDAFAQSVMAMSNSELQNRLDKLGWAKKSAVQGERDGFRWLGWCFKRGTGCKKNLDFARENYLKAIELGEVFSIQMYALLLSPSDPERYSWFARAAIHGRSAPIVSKMLIEIRDVNSGFGNASAVYAIGRALKGHIDVEKQTIFSSRLSFGNHIGPAIQAVRFYDFQTQMYRKAVDVWTILAIRCNIVKDIRRLIAQIIWEGRKQAKYLFVVGKKHPK
jgi:hypothetical protein